MFSRVISGIIYGADSRTVYVEADISNGFPSYTMVGYLASEVRESRDRVMTAMKNSGFSMRPAKITVNLSPADFRKEGTAFDLPVAAALMAAAGHVPEQKLKDTMLIGELGLDGSVGGVRGVLALVCEARAQGLKRCIVPFENVNEGAVVKGIDVLGVRSLTQLTDWLRDREVIMPVSGEAAAVQASVSRPGCRDIYDFKSLYGQECLKDAIEVAVAGRHHLLMVGAPGSGKSMAALCVPSVLPEMSFEECLEVTKLYSISGMLGKYGGLIKKRPFRQPHHTISPSAMVGGGSVPVPGEISLAHHGVLFLDELAEYNPRLIEMLRQPLENRYITINRVHGTYIFPGNFMLIAAMNPCPCGYYPDRMRCRCSASQIRRYLGHISFPILDRFDMGCIVSAVDMNHTGENRPCKSSAQMKENILKTQKIQAERFKHETYHYNAEIRAEDIKKYCIQEKTAAEMFAEACIKNRISVRSSHKILRTARTLADIDECDWIGDKHVAAALGYKSLDGKYWQGEIW